MLGKSSKWVSAGFYRGFAALRCPQIQMVEHYHLNPYLQDRKMRKKNDWILVNQWQSDVYCKPRLQSLFSSLWNYSGSTGERIVQIGPSWMCLPANQSSKTSWTASVVLVRWSEGSMLGWLGWSVDKMEIVKDELNEVLLSSTSSTSELPTQCSCSSSTGADGYTKLLRAVLLDRGMTGESSAWGMGTDSKSDGFFSPHRTQWEIKTMI